ncbi:unnamed protein product [Lactuca saligna]|uniref:Uncharacterized protein n=1 Tax=Lactuca saligna TaxID=75948 RepID=A0AA35Z5R5_LACSI|nr:unnamed protein product [Lactuca saligna]
MDNTPINGVRGDGFVDRKGRFFQTNDQTKGDGAMDEGSFMPNVVVMRGVVENNCNSVVPSPVMEDGCDLQGDSTHLVANMEGEGAAKSPSQPPGYRRDQSYMS